MKYRDRELAREAGIKMSHDDTLALGYLDNAHRKFAELVRADEREACAKVCDDFAKYSDWPTADNCAATIRARSNT